MVTSTQRISALPRLFQTDGSGVAAQPALPLARCIVGACLLCHDPCIRWQTQVDSTALKLVHTGTHKLRRIASQMSPVQRCVVVCALLRRHTQTYTPRESHRNRHVLTQTRELECDRASLYMRRMSCGLLARSPVDANLLGKGEGVCESIRLICANLSTHYPEYLYRYDIKNTGPCGVGPTPALPSSTCLDPPF